MKTVDKLCVELGVSDIQPALLKTMGLTKSKLIEWREMMTVYGCHKRAQEIQEFINMLVEFEKED